MRTTPTVTDYFSDLMEELQVDPPARPSADTTPAAMSGMSRRSFIKLSGLLGGGLALGFSLNSPRAQATGGHAGAVELSAYVQVREDGTVIIQAKCPEIGQGVKTALPMIVAEELDAAWEDVEVIQSPIDEDLYGRQIAGGSRAIPENWDLLRNAGATVRAMLLTAAASRLGVPESELRTENTRIIHAASNRSLHYGEVAEDAARLSVPTTVALKKVGEYRLLGRRITGVDNHKLVTGQPLFGIDQTVPQMSYAVYQKCPATGGRVVSANLDHIKTLKGVKDAFILEGNNNPVQLMPGVAIVADSTWAAFKARRELLVVWDESDASKDSWTAFKAQASELAAKAPESALVRSGDLQAAMSAPGATALSALYTHHFVSHATLEPQNTTAWMRPDGVLELWSPTQTPVRGINGIVTALGIEKSNILLHQTRAGGGFGRRLTNDAMTEAAAIAMRVDGPVKLQWDREDDTTHDFLRVGGFHQMQGAVDKDGKLSAYSDHLISFTEDGEVAVPGGNLRMTGFPERACPNALMAETLLPLKVPCGAWRAPGSNTIAWAQQSFLAELAAAAGRDPLEFLLESLAAAPEPENSGPLGFSKYRAIDTVKLAAQKAGWGKVLPEGRGMGVAFFYSHFGHVAEVAEVSVDANRKVTVHSVHVAADVGPIINRSASENLLEGAVIDALSTMMGEVVTFEDGRVEQKNFDHYPLLRMNKAPQISVHLIESDNHPSGLGEPGIPPLAPAVGNAIFAASGIRPRIMPLSMEGFSI